MQIVSNGNVKSCFLEKNKKNISNYCLLKILPRMLGVRTGKIIPPYFLLLLEHLITLPYLKEYPKIWTSQFGYLILCV